MRAGVATLFALLLLPAGAHAVPAAPVDQTLTQPSGTDFTAQLFGDEWYNGYETAGGYTILRDAPSEPWRYAEPAAGGELEPTGPRATAPAPGELDPHLRDPAKAEAAEGMMTRGSLGDGAANSPTPANTGSQPSLVILVQFNDVASYGTSAAQWRDRYFGATDSVKHYYNEVSYGNLAITPGSETHGTANDGVVGWLTLNRAHPRDNATNNRATVRDAIIAADPYVNYAAYDTNGNGAISANELHVTVIPAGREGSICGRATQPYVWGHQWSTFDLTPTVDGKQVGGSSSNTGSYTMFGEMHCNDAGQPVNLATVGIMVHEIGHDIDMPDLYDIDVAENDPDGVGRWSVMAGGSWGRTSGLYGSKPSHPDAWSKYYQGWTNPQQQSGTNSLTQAATSPSVMRLGANPGGVDWTFNSNSGTGEYFLVENRQQTGYDASLPGCGLVVWHIDETRPGDNTANANEARRMVDLEERDNNNIAGQAGDAYLGQAFGDATAPNSRFYSGAASNLGFSGGSSSCGATMSANFVNTGGPVAPPNNAFASPTLLNGTTVTRPSDSNAGATKEAGEPNHGENPGGASVWYQWTPTASGTVTVETVGSSFDTLLGVYTGSAVNGLTTIASNDDLPGGGSQQSRVTFNATAGTAYRIAVDGYKAPTGTPATGTVAIKLSQQMPPPPNDHFASMINLGTGSAYRAADSSAQATKQPGEPAHAGNAGGASLWYTWSAPAAGRLVVETLRSNFDTLLGIYRGNAVNALTAVASNDDVTSSNQKSRVVIPVTPGQPYRIAVDGFNGGGGAARGNVALRAIYDRAPTTTITSGPPASVTTPAANYQARYAFRANEAATFQCKLNGQAWASCTSPKTYTIPTSTQAKNHALWVRARDNSGQFGPAVRRTFSLRRG